MKLTLQWRGLFGRNIKSEVCQMVSRGSQVAAVILDLGPRRMILRRLHYHLKKGNYLVSACEPRPLHILPPKPRERNCPLSRRLRAHLGWLLQTTRGHKTTIMPRKRLHSIPRWTRKTCVKSFVCCGRWDLSMSNKTSTF